MSKVEVAQKCHVLRNTLPTWIKNKEKIFKAVDRENNPKRWRLQVGTYRQGNP